LIDAGDVMIGAMFDYLRERAEKQRRRK